MRTGRCAKRRRRCWEFRDPRAVGPLVEALHDEDRAVREAATTALRKIGPPAAPALIVALQDPNGNVQEAAVAILKEDRKSTRLNSSHGYISYAVFCLKKKNKKESTKP